MIILIILLLGWIDLFVGPDYNLFLFYFLPVSFAAWRLGFGPAIIITLICAFIWFGADVLSGHVYLTHMHAVWNTMIRLCSFLVIGWSFYKFAACLFLEGKKPRT